MSEQEPTSVQPGMVGARRYPRTFNGLIASMILLVAAVVSCSVLGNARGGHPDVACSAVPDWNSAVADAHAGGIDLTYPDPIPAGWKVTSATWDNDPVNQLPRWRLSLHNADCSQFFGLIEEQTSARSLVAQVVGSGEVSLILPGDHKMVIVIHATNQQVLDLLGASLTTVKLGPVHRLAG